MEDKEKMSDDRPSWDEYFMEMAELTAQRSTCLRRHVGAVIVRDKHAMATGYNGAPKGLRHCDELGGCLREKLHVPSGERHELCRALHAEQNAIIQAACLGESIDGGTIYIGTTAGISMIVYDEAVCAANEVRGVSMAPGNIVSGGFYVARRARVVGAKYNDSLGKLQFPQVFFVL